MDDKLFLDKFSMTEVEKDEFRKLELDSKALEKVNELSSKYNISREHLLATIMYDSQYNSKSTYGYLIRNTEKVLKSYETKIRYKEKELNALANAYKAIIYDVKYFPVASSNSNFQATVSYENAWMVDRTYGGERKHEGTDLMANINERGLYPIISMTDGIVENIGWLPQGGYRIGVRSPNGAYFYYAHLASYGEEFNVGDYVNAGQLLGMMGDTGYSEVEGTTGNFPVHLHLGIYIKTENYEELSVNPYYILKYVESKKMSYDF